MLSESENGGRKIATIDRDDLHEAKGLPSILKNINIMKILRLPGF